MPIVAVFLSVAMFLSPFISSAQAATISVKLSNYIGNKSSLSIETAGNYKLANGNIRFSGNDRFEVANNIASSGWNTASTVIVVNYKAFADALAATPLAYKYDAPILLTTPDRLTTETKLKIEQLRAEKAIIIGGTASVSASVGTELKGIVNDVTRIGGNDRFEVSKKIASLLGNSDTAVVTNGLVFADALSIAPYAAIKGYPILLSTKDRLPADTKAALQGKANSLVIGGEGSVSRNVTSQLPAPKRIGGKDRFEVSANIIRDLNLQADTAFMSNGLVFADALTGSVLAAKQNAPLLLTAPTWIPQSVKTVIAEENTSSFTILGGPASVSESVVSTLPNEFKIEQGTAHSVKVENGRLSLYKGTERVRDLGTSSFTLIPDQYSTKHQISVNNKNYLGNMEFQLESGRYVRPFNRNIPFEDYLKGVVPHEMPASWHEEALKAQAVAARTYSIDDIGKTVSDTQSYQVYGGATWVSGYWEQRTNKAVEETAGKVLRYNGRLISAVFSSSNGGYTESNANAWGTTAVPYLPAKEDTIDPKNPWSITMQKTQIDTTNLSLINPGHWWGSTTEANPDVAASLKGWLKKNTHPDSDIKIVSINSYDVDPKKTTGQRSINAKINFDYFVWDTASGPIYDENKEIKRFNIELPMSVKEFRTLFGTSKFKSTLLDPVETGTDSSGSDYIKIKGRGYGHGVGMSQHGAKKRAEQGHTYDRILNFYYPNTTLGK